jgi:hypothetical protein
MNDEERARQISKYTDEIMETIERKFSGIFPVEHLDGILAAVITATSALIERADDPDQELAAFLEVLEHHLQLQIEHYKAWSN